MSVSSPSAERFLTTASELFYEHGIANTGVDLIADRSGVAKTTMYKHFGNKDRLVAAYLEARSRAWRDHLSAEVEARSTDPREQLTDPI